MFCLFPVPVAVLEDPKDITHFVGGSINLTCTIFGDQRLEVVWFGNDTLISEADCINITNDIFEEFVWFNNDTLIRENNCFNITNTIIEETPNGITVQSSLGITNLLLADDVDYFCQGSNPGAFNNTFQMNSTSAHVTVQS